MSNRQGPNQYAVPAPPAPAGGRFNQSRPKTSLEWVELRAREMPGPRTAALMYQSLSPCVSLSVCLSVRLIPISSTHQHHQSPPSMRVRAHTNTALCQDPCVGQVYIVTRDVLLFCSARHLWHRREQRATEASGWQIQRIEAKKRLGLGRLSLTADSGPRTV